MKTYNIEKLLEDENKIKRWPKKLIEKEVVIGYLANQFDFNYNYSEGDINLILKEHHSFDDIALLLYEQALIQEGVKLEDPSGFVKRLNSVIAGKL